MSAHSVQYCCHMCVCSDSPLRHRTSCPENTSLSETALLCCVMAVHSSLPLSAIALQKLVWQRGRLCHLLLLCMLATKCLLTCASSSGQRSLLFMSLLVRLCLTWEQCVFPSQRSVLEARRRGDDVNFSELTAEQWCLSTEGLVLLLSHVAVHGKKTEE